MYVRYKPYQYEEFFVSLLLVFSFFLRFLQERDGLLVGPYEAPDRMKLQDSWLLEGVAPGFGRELFDSDIDRIAPYLEMAVSRFPAFGRAPITRTVPGPIVYAPDGEI